MVVESRNRTLLTVGIDDPFKKLTGMTGSKPEPVIVMLSVQPGGAWLGDRESMLTVSPEGFPPCRWEIWILD
jgi:hypothetical protein